MIENTVALFTVDLEKSAFKKRPVSRTRQKTVHTPSAETGDRCNFSAAFCVFYRAESHFSYIGS